MTDDDWLELLPSVIHRICGILPRGVRCTTNRPQGSRLLWVYFDDEQLGCTAMFTIHIAEIPTSPATIVDWLTSKIHRAKGQIAARSKLGK